LGTGGVVHRLLMQRLYLSQQSAEVAQVSSTNEHFIGGGTHFSMGTPSGDRPVSRQKPAQQSAPDSQVAPSP